MEGPAKPLLAARLVCADDRLRDAIRHALAAEGLQVSVDAGHEVSDGLDVLIVAVSDPQMDRIAVTTAKDFSDRVGGALREAFLALQAGVSAIRAGKGAGAVVFVAPPAGARRAFDTLRQGLRLMTKAAALELGPEQIRVNIVLPGGGESPLDQPCTASDIANAVAFAASPRSRFMTGADVVVDGGVLAL